MPTTGEAGQFVVDERLAKRSSAAVVHSERLQLLDDVLSRARFLEDGEKGLMRSRALYAGRRVIPASKTAPRFGST